MSATPARIFTARLVLPILCAAMLSFHASPSRAAKECKPERSAGSGVFPTDALAVADARASWTIYVTGSFGPAFSNWANAEGRSQTCRTVTTPVGVNGRSCRVRAKPCRYV